MDSLVRLLHDCDSYLERQRVLLDRSTALGPSDATGVAMAAALDQLARAVKLAWQDARTQMVRDTGRDLQDARSRRPEPARRADTDSDPPSEQLSE